MSRAVGSWITATGLKKFEPVVLRDALLTDKVKFDHNNIIIPMDLDKEKLNLIQLANYFHKKNESHTLVDALFCSIKLDSQEGLECVQETIEKHSIDYPEPEGKCYSNASRCLLLWLYVKDTHPYLLEESYGKLQTASPFTWHLYPVQTYVDLSSFSCATPEACSEIENTLANYFKDKTGQEWCRVVHYHGFEDEDWFMIRYPGNIECRPVLIEAKEKDDASSPLFFHTVVFDKKNNMLRTTVKTKKLCAKVKLGFGRMYFNDGNAFESSSLVLGSLLKVDKIANNWSEFCKTKEGGVIQNIRLSRVSCKFHSMGEVKSVCYLGNNDHLPVDDGDLFKAKQTLKTSDKNIRKSPADKLLEASQYIFWIQLSYQIVTDNSLRKREHKVTIKQGNTLGFEQDSGAVHLLDLLYEKQILEKR